MGIESGGVASVVTGGVDLTRDKEIWITKEGTDIEDDILSFIMINKSIVVIRFR
jgi:hypothetical protein